MAEARGPEAGLWRGSGGAAPPLAIRPPQPGSTRHQSAASKFSGLSHGAWPRGACTVTECVCLAGGRAGLGGGCTARCGVPRGHRGSDPRVTLRTQPELAVPPPRATPPVTAKFAKRDEAPRAKVHHTHCMGPVGSGERDCNKRQTSKAKFKNISCCPGEAV